MDATRALETLASRLEPNFNPRADAALREVWTRLDAAVGATNDALRETFLTQALNALNSTISRLKGGRLLTALLAKAAVECRFGRLAAALSTLNDVAATRCPLAQATQDKAFYWNRLRIAMEARDVLAALTGRPLWADVWRERAEFFKGWASSPTPTAERDEAFEIWRATELLTTDLGAAEEALRRAAFGKTQSLNVEAAALYEKTFGEKPSKPPKPKKRKKAPTPTNPQTTKSRARRWLKLTAFAFAVALAFVAFYLWASSRPTYKAAVNGVWAAKQVAGTRKTLWGDGVEYAFRYCPAGTFMMGSPTSESGRDDDETQREVKLTRGFWMLETEVTQEMWKSVMGSNPSKFDSNSLYPVEKVSWADAQDFIAKLNALGVAPEGFAFRLPTEAEWEYACRAGTTTPYFWGSRLNGDKANCDGRYPYGTSTTGEYLDRTTAVGSYDANAWGLYDMHGNVWEWCADWYGAYGSGSQTDPTGPKSGSLRVLRGGSWYLDAEYSRSACRGYCGPTYRFNYNGFRLVLGREL
ncbi:MAG: formylglycine-generating enzyme family protein [Thermoguttaceae bacterium]|nr:formylglycine-generating enzyme family protein [Thermoguttaceae bacterium]